MAQLSTSYGDLAYWEKRYEVQEGQYEWFFGYAELRDQLLKHLPGLVEDDKTTKLAAQKARAEVKVLITGCGNSDLTQHMYEDGFTDIVSIDYSSVCIQKMNAHMTSKKKPRIKFVRMDVRQMMFEAGSFDIILDKGTLDSILCGSDSAKNGSAYLFECRKVLKPGGTFLVFSYGQPKSRKPYLDRSKWKWKVFEEPSGPKNFLYVMKDKQ